MTKLREIKIMNTILFIGMVSLWLAIMFENGCLLY